MDLMEKVIADYSYLIGKVSLTLIQSGDLQNNMKHTLILRKGTNFLFITETKARTY